jgi:hypothetical protein
LLPLSSRSKVFATIDPIGTVLLSTVLRDCNCSKARRGGHGRVTMMVKNEKFTVVSFSLGVLTV